MKSTSEDGSQMDKDDAKYSGLDETAIDDLVHMQQAEVLELVTNRKIFDVHDEVPPRLYGKQFQMRVSEYLLDGG